jgi:hypothetical protein
MRPPWTITEVPSPFATGQGKPADAGDGGERFTAKTHGRDGGEILGLPDLRGRMALQAEQGVIAAHAVAIVRHPDERAPAGTDLDRDAMGVGIEGILDEFLHDRGRALDDLAGGDLVGDVVGEESDTVHVGDKVSVRKRAGQVPGWTGCDSGLWRQVLTGRGTGAGVG